MQKVRLYTTILFMLCFLNACWEYSPNQIFDDDTPADLNIKNISKLKETPGDDTVTIAFVGDSQRFYNELNAFVDKVNSIPSVDFILLAGDITDFGLLEEYEQVDKLLSGVNKPYISVIGNHDVLSHGEEVFKRMFGPPNASFIYNRIKFILHNTNSREYAPGTVPDMDWLSQQLTPNDSVDYFIGVSHIPPFDNGFDEGIEPVYVERFRNTDGFLLSLHGHIHDHKDGYPYEDHVRYITSYSFDQRSFVLLQIINGEVIKTIIDY